MIVFTETWLQEVTNRYRNHKRHTKPFVYFVATEDEFRPTRIEIEEWVAALPEHLQKKTVANLQAEANFQQTYHELVIGSLLRKLGLQTEYEKEFSGQTPDWFISSHDGSQHFVVEVVTENVSQSVASWDAQLLDLIGRIIELRFDFVISVHVSFDWNSMSLNSRRNKCVAAAVREWLANDNLSVGDKKQVDEVCFEVYSCDKGYPHVLTMGPSRSFWVVARPLRRNIENKIHKYRALATAHQIPLVVAVLPEFRTGYDAETLENALLGQDGLFKDRPLLSGVIFAYPADTGQWGMKNYLNPNARNPLPAKMFL